MATKYYTPTFVEKVMNNTLMVRLLHFPVYGNTGSVVCVHCSNLADKDISYPCDTMLALDGKHV